ncbi:MAG: DUF3054 domain-containing protein [Anaerolineales bacterium]|nr:DUF3054 domain-containing protein [Anaerolineales bacterium]
MPTSQKFPYALLLGDAVVFMLITLTGFASHDRLGSSLWRMLTTFVPLIVSWALIGVHVGVFDPARVADPRQLWRPFWAMVLAGPFAGWMRGVMLASGVAPLFVVVLGGFSALALLVWRTLFWFLTRNKSANQQVGKPTN